MKLISMTDFVLHESFGVGNEIINHQTFFKKVSSYAQFLKKPLELGMFIPCDEEGNILEQVSKPDAEDYRNDEGGNFELYNFNMKAYTSYKKAKNRVLFDGFVFTDSQKYSIPLSVSPYGLKDEKIQLTKLKDSGAYHTWLQLNTIEDLVQCDLKLTENALAHIGLMNN